MAKKPFRVDAPGPSATDIGRMPDGKFTRFQPPGPPRIVRESSERGVDVDVVIGENRAPEHPSPKGSPPGSQEIPWPPAGPINDANKKPMRVG